MLHFLLLPPLSFLLFWSDCDLQFVVADEDVVVVVGVVVAVGGRGVIAVVVAAPAVVFVIVAATSLELQLPNFCWCLAHALWQAAPLRLEKAA